MSTTTTDTLTAKQADAIRNRLEVLRRIIKLDSTPDGEKAAAVHMAQKLQAKLDTANVSDPETRRGGSRYYQLPEIAYGEKYAETRHLSVVQVAKLVRAEIKLLRKLAKQEAKAGGVAIPNPITDAPDGVKFYVRSTYSKITINVTGFPADWGWHPVEYPYPHEGATRELGELGIALNDIAAVYNYDGSDSMVDYVNNRFYLFVYGEGRGIPQWGGQLCRCDRCDPIDYSY